ncbi:hypothetical protein K4F52_008093 [Lecanicillium sp. MT-2017a]|nr:hypothetical protein K4F52_008093 [Lecanicillium sp. MT-2017a]
MTSNPSQTAHTVVSSVGDRHRSNGQGSIIIAVAGASGNIGRQVVSLLLAHGQSTGITVLALSRRLPDPSDDAPDRLIHKVLDYGDPASLRAAFTGVDTVVFPGSDGDPGVMLNHHRNVVAAASSCSVRRIVYLTALDTDPDSPFPYAQVHQATEKLLGDAGGLQVSVLRASIFSEFFLSAFIGPALSQGALHLPNRHGRVSFVSRLDVAAALAGAALDGSSNGVFNVTGPDALTIEEVVGVVREVTGQPLRYECISEDSYRKKLTAEGVEPCYVDAFATMLAHSIPRGSFQLVSNDVADLSHQPVGSFKDSLQSWLSDQNIAN